MKKGSGVFVVAALLAAWCPPAKAETAADWDWVVAPYLWGASVGLDITANNDPVIGADASFKDLLGALDLAALVHFEGQCEHAGFFVDAVYMELGAEKTGTARPPLPGGTVTQADLTLGIYEVAGFYRAPGRAHGLDLILGARMIDLRSRVEATIPPPINDTILRGIDENLIDAFGGIRYLTPIGKRWDFVIRGDVGAGGTDLTWNAVASFGVRLGKTDRYNLRFGWHHMQLDVTAENPQRIEIESDMALTGPFFGFAMKF